LTCTGDVIRSRGLQPVPVVVDERGVRSDLLTGEAALLTPAHQMPIGVPLAPNRRTAAVEWARETGAVLIDDDFDGEFRYDRQPVGALQALDPERVVYAGTASKSLAPSLRLAWMVLPQPLIEPVIAAKRTADLQTGTLDQLTLAEFIASGHYDRHVRRRRLRYRRRRDRLVQMLAVRAPGVRVAGISAGMHVLLDVPGDAQDMVDRAARQGLALVALDDYRFRSDPAARQALVVGYGTPPDHSYTGAWTSSAKSSVSSVLTGSLVVAPPRERLRRKILTTHIEPNDYGTLTEVEVDAEGQHDREPLQRRDRRRGPGRRPVAPAALGHHRPLRRGQRCRRGMSGTAVTSSWRTGTGSATGRWRSTP
jgi:hypothetical protein